jgi:hypothetical protein
MCFHRAAFRAEVSACTTHHLGAIFRLVKSSPKLCCPASLQAMTSTWIQPVPAIANHRASSIPLLTLAVSGDIVLASASATQICLDGRGINYLYCHGLIPIHSKQETTLEKSAGKEYPAFAASATFGIGREMMRIRRRLSDCCAISGPKNQNR